MAKLSELLGGYIERLGSVWVEGEITQWGESGGNVYGKLRDSDADASVAFTVWRRTRSEIPEESAKATVLSLRCARRGGSRAARSR